MDINALFRSKFLKAVDLQGQPRPAVIQSVAPEELGQGEVKPVMHFVGVQRGLVLNRTNGLLLAASFGNETDSWIGKEIELYQDNVVFQGRVVPAIRVRTVNETVAPATPSGAAFPAQQPATSSAPPTPHAAAAELPPGREAADAGQTPRPASAPPSTTFQAPAVSVHNASTQKAESPIDDDIAW